MESTQKQSNSLLQIGVLLFTMALLTGFGMPFYASPRLGLSSHLAGVMNGMFLLIMGIIWHKIQLSTSQQKVTFYLLIFSTVANWLANLLGAIWGAGETIVPLAADNEGTISQEMILKGLFGSLSVGFVLACFFILKGLNQHVKN
jgi:(hydroxyamino)benzene mutase